tara:strand:+ start:132 stop:305 length:174 start_codon:yes stop_codon:yes gene_type:complete
MMIIAYTTAEAPEPSNLSPFLMLGLFALAFYLMSKVLKWIKAQVERYLDIREKEANG